MGARTDQIAVTPELLKRYDKPGPRYTSYPTVPVWPGAFSEEDYRSALARAAARPDDGLSLYVHIPFCSERCAYCGCNVVISKKPEVVGTYLDHVARELEMLAEALGERRRLVQLHWGGGTPTYLPPAGLERLHGAIARHFRFDPQCEVAIEVDPRVTSRAQIQVLRALGFNRISMGVQDLDPDVQEAIGRNQTEAETRELFDWCREEGFEGINVDLIYGLPKQTPATWARTLESVLDIAPDRLAMYSYAHLPDRLKHQAKIDAADLPNRDTKFGLFAEARRRMAEGGYRVIGMDHFAHPEDELAVAMDEGRLHRNFMGYTTIADTEMVGVGPSAIGQIGGAFAQNEKRLAIYYRQIDERKFPVSGGCPLSEDDAIRAWTIQQLMCNFTLNFATFEARFETCFSTYFAEELSELEAFVDEGFVRRTELGLEVLPLGQIFVRNLAMVFDAYLRRSGAPVQFSRTV